jgi:hypothetical protein
MPLFHIKQRKLNQSHKKIYVASSWKNTYFPIMIEELRKCNYDVYDFRNPNYPEKGYGFHWESIAKDWKHWLFHQYIQAVQSKEAEAGFMLDFNAMSNADACILLLPSGRSAHIEAGFMRGKGKLLGILIPSINNEMPEGFDPELMYRLANVVSCHLTDILETFETLWSK